MVAPNPEDERDLRKVMFKLPNICGQYVRGVNKTANDGKASGADPDSYSSMRTAPPGGTAAAGRVGSLQNDCVKKHTHTLTENEHSHTTTVPPHTHIARDLGHGHSASTTPHNHELGQQTFGIVVGQQAYVFGTSGVQQHQYTDEANVAVNVHEGRANLTVDPANVAVKVNGTKTGISMASFGESETRRRTSPSSG